MIDLTSLTRALRIIGPCTVEQDCHAHGVLLRIKAVFFLDVDVDVVGHKTRVKADAQAPAHRSKSWACCSCR